MTAEQDDLAAEVWTDAPDFDYDAGRVWTHVGEQDDLSPAAIMAEHCADDNGSSVGYKCYACGENFDGFMTDWPCLPYRLAQALSQAQSELERIASHTRDAYDQRDAAQEALAASEAKVARVEALEVQTSDDGSRWVDPDDVCSALASPTPAPCPRTTPFKSYTEPTCSRPEGHAGGCLFNSHDGRTPLEVMPG